MKFRTILWLSSAMVMISIAVTAALAEAGEIPNPSGPLDHGHHMMWGGGQWGGFGMILWPIFMTLIMVGIIVAIVAGIIYFLRLSGVAGPRGDHFANDRALAVLKERYAKGEIDSEEFAERKKLLTD